MELNDYYISNVVTTKNIYKDIQNKILKESESIHETPKRNYKLEILELEDKKQKLFQLKKNNWDLSIKGFSELLIEINQIIREVQHNNDIPQIQNFVDLYNSTKLSMATTYMFNKKYDEGKRLIDELIFEHPYYLRPFIKKMEYFHTRGELDNAKELYDKIESFKSKLNEKDNAYYLTVKAAFEKDWTPYEKVFLSKICIIK